MGSVVNPPASATTTVPGSVSVPSSGKLAVDGSGNITLGAHGTTHEPGGTDDLYLLGGNLPSTAVETVARWTCSSSLVMVSGTLYLVMFTPALGLVVTTVGAITAGTQTASGCTLCRLGLYTVDGSGNSTLVAATASDTALLAAQNTSYSKALSLAGDLSTSQTSYTLVRGSRYALGAIWVGTTPPTLVRAPLANNPLAALSPVLTGVRAGQSDLTLSNTTSNAAAGTSVVYGSFS